MIILMGVAGAGKSLQGQMFVDGQGYHWLSTGELFRSQLSEERQKELATGKLLGDQEVIDLVDKTIEEIDSNKKVVMDGFPRTISQCQWLLDQVKKERFDIEAVFVLVVSFEVVKKRLLNRGRSDDSETAIKQRFDEYTNKTAPVIDY